MIRRRTVNRTVILSALSAVLPLLLAAVPASAVTVGEPAPAFELKDTSGKTVRLSDFKGQTVVLEWTNPGCPFVVKHYGSKNMQALQQEARDQKVVWLSVSSTAPTSSDYLAPAALAAKYQAWGASAASILLDDSGSVGRAYGAKTTPHLFVIDSAGTLAYAGGIDDKRSANPSDIAGAKNYVRAALGELAAGKPVSTRTAPPYGCSVKYAG